MVAARGLLDLPEAFTPKELRHAYFRKARESHPDAVGPGDDDDSSDAARQFIAFSDAYDALRAAAGEAEEITQSEEDDFRAACQAELGLDAEIVEEAKKCYMFRIWAQKKTDTASFWRRFLYLNGGLAPRLRPRVMVGAGGGDSAGPRKRVVRRRVA